MGDTIIWKIKKKLLSEVEVMITHQRSKTILFCFILIAFLVSSCINNPEPNDSELQSQASGMIYLYGEQHGVAKIYNKEFELWYEYYHDKNMRHLFIEMPYYTAEFLNLWMQSDDDNIFEEIYMDWEGTATYNPYVKDFYKRIKDECPETVFHGTDVGHQYDSTGKRFLKNLESNNLTDSEQYSLAREAIEQGEYYYSHSDEAYRENKMAENFKREYDKLNDESIMGIYGAAHTGLDAMAYKSNSVPCMANQLKKYYGKAIQSEDLSYIALDTEPIRVDILTINDKEYEASYFGKVDLQGFKGYAYREYWRLENAYDDFRNNPLTNDVLPYDQYPMKIETGQIFVIDYTKMDGSYSRLYYRSDGYIWNDRPSTQQFTLE